MGTFCGLRGSDDFPMMADGVTPLLRQHDWRNLELLLRPNGASKLTALLSLTGKGEKLKDPKFYWIERQELPRSGAVTGLYDDPALSVAYVDAADPDGFVVYVNVAEAVAKRFIAGDLVMLSDKDDYQHDTRAEVKSVVLNGANSYLTCRLIEAAGGHGGTYLSVIDYIYVIGNAHPEGDVLPDSRVEDPSEVENYAQIFMRSADITRTAGMIQNLRVARGYAAAKDQALKQFMMDLELATLFGKSKLTTGANGKPKRYTQGIWEFIKAKNTALADADNPLVDDYRTTALISGAATWTGSGKWWLDYHIMKAFEWGDDGSDERLVLCDNLSLMAIQELVMHHGDYSIDENTSIFGFKVTKFRNVFGTLNLSVHPYFNTNPVLHNTMLWLVPQDIKQRPFLDTTYVGPTDVKQITQLKQNGYHFVDALKGGYIAELGIEYHHPMKGRILRGVGLAKAS